MAKEIKILGFDTWDCGYESTETKKREDLERRLNECLKQGYERKERFEVSENTFWIFLEREKKEKDEKLFGLPQV